MEFLVEFEVNVPDGTAESEVPDPLEPPEDGRALIWCSHPTSDVALAL
jgi:hypothetical protein